MAKAIQIRMGGYGPATTGFSKSLKFIGERLERQFGDRIAVKYVWNVMDFGYRAEDILWLVESGVLCSVATNNVQNPFTPFGDASLLRMANFYANVAHAGISEFDVCLDLVTELPARLMNLRDYGIAPGNPADFVILDTDSGTNAIAELPDMLMGFKSGRQVFERRKPTLFPPQG